MGVLFSISLAPSCHFLQGKSLFARRFIFSSFQGFSIYLFCEDQSSSWPAQMNTHISRRAQFARKFISINKKNSSLIHLNLWPQSDRSIDRSLISSLVLRINQLFFGSESIHEAAEIDELIRAANKTKKERALVIDEEFTAQDQERGEELI